MLNTKIFYKKNLIFIENIKQGLVWFLCGFFLMRQNDNFFFGFTFAFDINQ